MITGFSLRLRVLAGAASILMILAPSGGRAEQFAGYWASLSVTEQQLVDRVAAEIYGEENGRRAASFAKLNSASKARYRARAIEVLGVQGQPVGPERMGAEV